MLEGLFWFTAIVGVGVTAIDLLGLIGHGHAEGGDDGAGDAAGADDGSGHVDGADDGSGHAEGVDDGSGHTEGGDSGSGVPVLSFLRYARTAIYFCLGFGPFGLASTAFGSGPVGSLIWALGGGAGMAVLARAFFKFQRSELDSSVQEEELLFEDATVIAPIADGGMGKVRIRLGQSVAERYAIAENPAEKFEVDARVQVAQVTDRCVYVRRIDPSGEMG